MPEPCRAMTPGGAGPAVVAEPAGQGNRVGGRLAQPLPSGPSVARRSPVRGFLKPGRTDV